MAAGNGNAFVAVSDGVYRLEAPLTFATVARLRPKGMQIIEAQSQGLTLDLKAVPNADSAGLALLIDWLAYARSQSRTLKYSEPSAALLSLARLSDVEKLIA